MKASIVAAHALLVVGLVAAQSGGTERASEGGAPVAGLAPAASPVCRAAAWPYVPAECGAQASPRRVRVLRAEAGR